MGWFREEYRNVHKRGSSRGRRRRTQEEVSGRREKVVADARALAVYAEYLSDPIYSKMILISSFCLNKLDVA